MAKKKEEVKSESTTLMVISGGLLSNVDLNALNSIIENIGTADKIEECDKKPALAAIETWQESVIDRAQHKIWEINAFTNKFNQTAQYIDEEDFELFENIAAQINAKELFEKFKFSYGAYKSVKKNSPDELLEDVTKTYEQQFLDKKTHDYNQAVYEMNVKKAQKNLAVVWNELREVVNNSEDVQKTIDEMKKYAKKLSKFKTDCVDKAAYAKLNISIASADLRKALRDLLNFGLSI